MERRFFIKNACAACGALALTNTLLSSCGTSAKTVSIYKAVQQNGKIAIPLGELSQTMIKLVRVKDYAYDVAVNKKSDGNFLALVLRCTHAGQALTKTGSSYFCKLHGSRFTQEGAVLKGPASSPLEQLQTQTDDQYIWITLDHSYNS